MHNNCTTLPIWDWWYPAILSANTGQLSELTISKSVSTSTKSALDFLRRALSWLSKSAASSSEKSESVGDDLFFSLARSDSRFSISASRSEIFWLAVTSREFSSEISRFFLTTRRSVTDKVWRKLSISSVLSGLSDSVGDSLRLSIFPAVPPFG